MKDFIADFVTGYIAGIVLGAFLMALVLFAVGCSKDPGVPVDCKCAKCEASK